MNLIDADIVGESCRLSLPTLALAFLAAFALWLTGWMYHKFWLVVGITFTAGIVGLQSGRGLASQPLVAGLLLALAAGLMSAELARVGAFTLSGFAACATVQTFVPNAHEPLAIFLVGGLLAIFLFRPWVLVVTSMVGTLVLIHAGLGLAHLLLKLDAGALVASKATAFTAAVPAGTILGVLSQVKYDHLQSTKGKRKKAKALAALSDEERNHLKKLAPPPPKSPWWKKLGKKAG